MNPKKIEEKLNRLAKGITGELWGIDRCKPVMEKEDLFYLRKLTKDMLDFIDSSLEGWQE